MFLDFSKNSLNIICSSGKLVDALVYEAVILSLGRDVDVRFRPTPPVIMSEFLEHFSVASGKGKQ